MKSVAVGLALVSAVLAANDISGAISAWNRLVADVKTADSDVTAWNGHIGTSGPVINGLATVGNDLDSLNKILYGFSDVTDAEASKLFAAIAPDVPAVAKLLTDSIALKTKVKAIVVPIVSGQIASLQPGVYSVMDAFYAQAPCDYSSSVVSIATPIANAYLSLDSVFSVPTMSLPAFAHTTGCSATSSSAVSSTVTSSSAVSSTVTSSSAVSSTVVSSTVVSSTAVSSTAVSSTAVSSTAVSSTAVSSTAVSSTAVSSTAVSSTAVSSTAVSSTAVSSTAVSSTAVSSTAVSSSVVSSAIASVPVPYRNHTVTGVTTVSATTVITVDDCSCTEAATSAPATAAVSTPAASTAPEEPSVAVSNGAARLVGGSALALVLGSVALLM